MLKAVAPKATPVARALTAFVRDVAPGASAATREAASAINAPRLAMQLVREEGESAFTPIRSAKQILTPSQIKNTNVPDGFGKFTTDTFQSPSGPFQVHFYMNKDSLQIFYGVDYKAVFNASDGPAPFQPYCGQAP